MVRSTYAREQLNNMAAYLWRKGCLSYLKPGAYLQPCRHLRMFIH